METSDVKIEKIDIQPTSTYISPEVKRRQQYKHYNNTYVYISIRPSFLKAENGERKSLRQLWNNNFVPWLQNAVKENLEIEEEDERPFGHLDVDQIKIQQIFESYMTVTTGSILQMREICKALKKKPEMLACEYLDKKRVFGDKASIDEMSSFKSKVKKQTVEYDPDEEKEKEDKKRRAEAVLRQAGANVANEQETEDLMH